jgi:hypothetical protein
MTSDDVRDAEDSELRPQWSKGDTWGVRYRVLVPSTQKTTDGPATWQEDEWDYRVEDITDAGGVEISARVRGSAGKPWAFHFNPSGRVRAFQRPGDEMSLASGGLYFPREEGWWDNIVTEWPAFPIGPNPGTRELDDGIRQTTQLIDGAWKITVQREYELAGARMIKTMEQTWHPGRPWWTTMSIRMRMDFEGKTSDGLEVHGELLPPMAAKEP